MIRFTQSFVSCRAARTLPACGDQYSHPCTQSFYYARSLSTSKELEGLTVSILGPPNAGKSTLFNRLLCKEANRAYRLQTEKNPRRRKGTSKGRIGSNASPLTIGGAIVSSAPGTTRDRRECIGRIAGITFRLIDTAGVDGERKDSKHPLDRAMMQQTLEAAQSADLIFLMFDARIGITMDFMETARWLRKMDSPGRVVLLANKLEGDSWAHNVELPVMDHLAEAARVGFGEAVPISAQHGEGMADLAVLIEEQQRKKNARHVSDDTQLVPQKDSEKPLQLAILGKQNVGKSTLVNALLKKDRVIVGPTPGLTRDAIAVEWDWNGRKVQLVDTAGIRKISQREDTIENLAVHDAMRAMKVADVAVLVLDAKARYLTRQELVIANAVVKEGRSLVVAANKMDLLIDEDYTGAQYARAVQEQIYARIPILRRTPVVAMSSLTGEAVHKLMPVVFDARDRWARVISTGVLNRWLAEVIHGHPLPMYHGRPIKIKYIMQTKGRPPTFLLFGNVSEVPSSYMRYLVRNFQDTFDMFGMEIRMAMKKSANDNPFSDNRAGRSGFGLGGKHAQKTRLVKNLKKMGGKPKRRRRKS